MTKKKIWQTTDLPQAPAPKAPNKASRAELELVLKRAQELVRKNPEKAAIILATWIGEKKSQKNTKKAA
jgi:flagellar biosynthesis/type III secretory pathway M-ring protein FliF/YscJ